jgi:hypothetical protein
MQAAQLPNFQPHSYLLQQQQPLPVQQIQQPSQQQTQRLYEPSASQSTVEMVSQDFNGLTDPFSMGLSELRKSIRRLTKLVKNGGATQTQMDQLRQLQDRVRRDFKDFKPLHR